MKFYFLREDFEKLTALIGEVSDRIRVIGQEMGASCQEGAETFHDNFAYEEGERQQRMWSTRLKELLDINRNAAIIEGSDPGQQVGIGSRVTIAEIETGEEKTVFIGSYQVFSNSGRISYNSPLGKMLLGGEEGEVVVGEIAGKEKKFEIVAVH
jgi:transcription elongation GreA/GreB family factor